MSAENPASVKGPRCAERCRPEVGIHVGHGFDIADLDIEPEVLDQLRLSIGDEDKVLDEND